MLCVAYPCISTGVYRFPKEIAVRIAVNGVMKLLSERGSIEKVIFVCFDEDNYSEYKRYI